MEIEFWVGLAMSLIKIK